MDFETDIRIVDGDFSVGPDGDLETVSGLECLIQDIRHEAMTYPGDLFYEPTYGFGLQDFIQRQITDVNRDELINRMTEKLLKNERIEPDSVEVLAQSWTLESITTHVKFSAFDEDVRLKMTIETDQVTVEVVSG